MTLQSNIKGIPRSLMRLMTTIRPYSLSRPINCYQPDNVEMAIDLTQFMHGRKNKERRDSVNSEILNDRRQHQQRISNAHIDNSILQAIEKLGLGTKRRKYIVYAPTSPNSVSSTRTQTGAGGFAVHVASASSNWPIFKHILPEMAFAGHSNSGKSTLVNAISGIHPKKGPASVSERAGWTDQVCFYQLGKRPPVLTMADLPGYGHAVATADEKRAWSEMGKDYLSTRAVLSRCCLLVDCTRGLCAADISWVKFLIRAGVEWQVVLTKCDLLSANDLARSIAVVESDLLEIIKGTRIRAKDLAVKKGAPVSAPISMPVSAPVVEARNESIPNSSPSQYKEYSKELVGSVVHKRDTHKDVNHDIKRGRGIGGERGSKPVTSGLLWNALKRSPEVEAAIKSTSVDETGRVAPTGSDTSDTTSDTSEDPPISSPLHESSSSETATPAVADSPHLDSCGTLWEDDNMAEERHEPVIDEDQFLLFADSRRAGVAVGDPDTVLETIHAPGGVYVTVDHAESQSAVDIDDLEGSDTVDINGDDISDDSDDIDPIPTNVRPQRRLVIPVSASTGAGIKQLWAELRKAAARDSPSVSAAAAAAATTREVAEESFDSFEVEVRRAGAAVGSRPVREHRLAGLLRSQFAAAEKNKVAVKKSVRRR